MIEDEEGNPNGRPRKRVKQEKKDQYKPMPSREEMAAMTKKRRKKPVEEPYTSKVADLNIQLNENIKKFEPTSKRKKSEPKPKTDRNNKQLEIVMLKDLINYVPPIGGFSFQQPETIKKKKPIKKDWVVYAKVGIIWDWRGQLRFFIMDEEGTEVKCLYEHDANRKYYRDLIKKNQYYSFSKGVLTFDPDKRLRLITFNRKAVIQQLPRGNFKLNPKKVIKIHEIPLWIQNQKSRQATVIGIVKQTGQAGKKGKKIIYYAVLCDPIYKYQVRVNQLYFQRIPEIGQVMVLHLFDIVDTKGVISLTTNKVSYYSIEDDKQDQLINLYLNSTHVGWQDQAYLTLKLDKYLMRSIQKVYGYSLEVRNRIPLLSILQCKIRDLQRLKDTDRILVTVDDDSGQMKLQFFHHHMKQILIDITPEEYDDLVKDPDTDQLEQYLRRLIYEQIEVQMKSQVILGNFQHDIEKVKFAKILKQIPQDQEEKKAEE